MRKNRRVITEPDGRAVASPVWQAPECIGPFGNLYEQSAEALWNSRSNQTATTGPFEVTATAGAAFGAEPVFALDICR